MQSVIVGFGRFLREQGFSLSQARILSAIQTAELAGAEDKVFLRSALRSALTGCPEDFIRFGALFDEYFFKNRPTEGAAPSEARPARPDTGLARHSNKATEPGQALASPLELLGRRGFDDLNPEEARLMAREVEKLLLPLAKRLSRRKKPGGRQELAWRMTMRASLGMGGELARLQFKKPTLKTRRLVILADVSGSMDIGSPYIFHFLKGLTGAWSQVEVFAFATRLTRLTAWLPRLEVSRLIKALPGLVPDLAGGTRLGPALLSLRRRFRGVLGPHSVALIVSDGWDRGDPGILRREMAGLHAACHRVIWLNPLLSSPRYRPINQGMSVALPYVDCLLGCHNLISLKKVATLLTRELDRRGARFPSV